MCVGVFIGEKSEERRKALMEVINGGQGDLWVKTGLNFEPGRDWEWIRGQCVVNVDLKLRIQPKIKFRSRRKKNMICSFQAQI